MQNSMKSTQKKSPGIEEQRDCIWQIRIQFAENFLLYRLTAFPKSLRNLLNYKLRRECMEIAFLWDIVK